MNAVTQYLQTAFGTMVRRGAKMSKKNAGWAYLALGIAILFVPLFVTLALEHAGQSLVKEYISWALVGLFATGFISMPTVLYGYHNRHRIDTDGVDEGYDFSHAHRAGLAAAA
ncbi:MAG: hypothetical protein ACR2Q4_23655, partial [Geminicoccaceae bacterium]